MSAIRYLITALSAFGVFLLPSVAMAAGEKADMLIHVADTRVVQSEITIFFLNSYNTDPFMFGVWCTLITLAMGLTLGLTTDFIMKRTGIDLTKRTIVEH
ncbi:MAG TPA: DVU0150 family protein [Desulfomonilaceae bacterium]|nr:DVU0150 family protein [Desulfomonilaceae bacterium]